MAKKFVLIDPNVPTSELRPAIDWSKCVLCQQQTKDKLSCPDKAKSCSKDAGYQSLAAILPDFEKLGKLPRHLVGYVEGLYDLFKANKAKWHKGCRDMYSARELSRKTAEFQKRVSEAQAPSSDYADVGEFSGSIKRRCTRSDFDTENPLRAPIPVCFFCDLPAGQQQLHAVSTFDVHARVSECASVLCDTRLMAKLAIGDMIALESKYHTSCLLQLYNRRRAHERTGFRELSTTAANTESLLHIAFAELTAYINDVRSLPDIVPVFKLADLKKLYADRLQQLNTTSQTVNSTRLKEKLLAYFPDMRAQTDGRDIVLAFEGNLGSAVSKACTSDLDEDALHLARAAEIVRRDLFAGTYQFHRSFENDSQINSVPVMLLSLVNMILEGPSIDVQAQQQHTPAALTIAQLFVFNSVRRKRTSASQVATAVRHAPGQETPLPLYVGLALHAATRKKRLINKLFDLGICVSYDRVLSVLNDLARGVSDRFAVENAVCPLTFKHGVFTTAAVDNIDHNPSSTTAHNSFHGTGISLHQHPDSAMLGSDRTVDCLVQPQIREQVCSLPASYIYVKPARLVQQEPSIPVPTVVSVVDEPVLANETEWLGHLWNNWHNNTFTRDSVFPWSAYHAQNVVTTDRQLTICGMLPLFHEHAQSVAMIRHAMDVIQMSVSKLNPSQVPVIAFDQPLYSLAKLIQWNWPDRYGEDRFVVMFGGLHVEMAALKALGSLLTGSGWVKAVTDAGIVTSGSAEGLLSASHVRRCRRTHEVTLAALHILQLTAFHKLNDEELSFDDWCSKQVVSHRQFAFWSGVMQLESAVLSFVRSLREAQFELYVNALNALLPWFFALDRTNYARWLSVHVRDMQEIASRHPTVFAQFEKGKFTVNKNANKFSSIALDQAHEQLNAAVKGDGGMIGLTDNDVALRRLLVAGPEVARLLSEFESNVSADPACGSHHENTPAAKQAFVNDVMQMVATVERMGNPFLDERDLIVLHNRMIVSEEIADLAVKIFEVGKAQYDNFVLNRLVYSKEPLFAPLRKNKFAFFAMPKPVQVSKLKSAIAASRNDSALFSRLYIACQIRNSDLDQFFCHENQVYPPSLSDSGALHFGCKSDLLDCLECIHPSVQTKPDVDAAILDGSAIVNMLRPCNINTFGDYVSNVFMPFIYSQLTHVRRIDVVWDRYDALSIKCMARAKRGVSVRQQVTPSAPIPRNWHDFLRCDENKTALFCFLAEQMCSKPVPEGKQLIGTCDVNVKCSQPYYNTSQLEPCTQEEADTRMLLHACDAISAGHTNVLLRTVDTDVVVLAVAFLQNMSCSQLWIAFGTGNHFRYIAVHELAIALGPEKSCALPVFHAISGCDTVSAFIGRGKRTCWDIWRKCPEVTEVFVELFHMPVALSDNCLRILQQFVVRLYDASYDCDSVNVARKKLFAKKGKSIQNIPPTLDAFVQHTRRAVYQAGYVWSQSLVLQPKLPSPSDWGWHMVDNIWHPLWMTLPDAAKCCPELKRCGCKSGCMTKRCRCVKDNIPCTALCACDGECRQ